MLTTPLSRAKKAKRGYFISQNMIFDQSLSVHAKMVYLLLCRMADSEGQSFPGKQYIAVKCSIGKTKVYEALRELASLGLVSTEQQFNEDRQTSNLYTIYDEPGEAFPYPSVKASNNSSSDESNTVPPIRNANPSPFATRTPDHSRREPPPFRDANAKDNLLSTGQTIGGGVTAKPSPHPAAKPPPLPPMKKSVMELCLKP